MYLNPNFHRSIKQVERGFRNTDLDSIFGNPSCQSSYSSERPGADLASEEGLLSREITGFFSPDALKDQCLVAPRPPLGPSPFLLVFVPQVT